MASKVKTTFDYKDAKQSTLIITSAAAIGVIYSIAKRKTFWQTAGLTLVFALGGVVVSIVTNNLTDGQ